jgi:Cys-tRNA(Pro)/Cys-tRNA(Cys) deacylase
VGKKSSTKTMPMRELENHGVEYKPLQQSREQFTAEGVADDLRVPICQVVKAMLIRYQGDRGSDQFAIFVTPGDRRLSLKKAKSILGDKEAGLASEKDVERTTGFRIGAVSVLGFRRRDISQFVDQTVLTMDQIVISSGRPDLGLALGPSELVKAMDNPVIGEYCEEL